MAGAELPGVGVHSERHFQDWILQPYVQDTQSSNSEKVRLNWKSNGRSWGIVAYTHGQGSLLVNESRRVNRDLSGEVLCESTAQLRMTDWNEEQSKGL